MPQCYMQYNHKCADREGVWESTRHFYKSSGTIFNKYNYQHLCKYCIQDYIGEFVLNEDRVIDICRITDIVFIRSLYKKVNNFSDYLKIIASSYKSMGFNNSAFEDDELGDLTEEDRAEMVLKWGEGYSTAELLYLTNEFNNLMSSYEVKDYIQELYFKHICITQLQLEKAIKNGNSTKDLIDQLNKLVKMADLAPSDRKTDGLVYGEKIRLIENSRPIKTVDPELEDVDKIGYITKYFVNQMRRVFGDDETKRSIPKSNT